MGKVEDELIERLDPQPKPPQSTVDQILSQPMEVPPPPPPPGEQLIEVLIQDPTFSFAVGHSAAARTIDQMLARGGPEAANRARDFCMDIERQTTRLATAHMNSRGLGLHEYEMVQFSQDRIFVRKIQPQGAPQ